MIKFVGDVLLRVVAAEGGRLLHRHGELLQPLFRLALALDVLLHKLQDFY